MMKKISLEIEGMHCKSCEFLIEGSLNGIGVKEVYFKGNKVIAYFDKTKIKTNDIKKAIRDEGYKVT